MRVSRLRHQANIEYLCIPTIFSLYMSIYASYGFRDIVYEKLSRKSSEATLTFKLARLLVLKLFSKSLSYDPNIVQGTGDSIRWVSIGGTYLTKYPTVGYPSFICEGERLNPTFVY